MIDKETETSAVKIDVATRLAIERTRVAYDRTMLAWVRTAISLITFGFAIYKFFQLDLHRGQQEGRWFGPREFGLTMVIIGLISLVLAAWENRANMEGLRALHADVRYSRAGLIAALISLLGILALIVIISRQ